MIFRGSGPGAQARDGCSVELYRQLPYLGELDAVRDCLHAGATLLELGCGTGRLTRVLLAMGVVPTCVDNSPDMLRHLPIGVQAVEADVENLALPQHFDVVLLASSLVNHFDPLVRNAFIACAARHCKAGGVLLVERQDAEALRTMPAGWQGSAGPAQLTVDHVERTNGITTMRLRYVIGHESWTQEFAAVALDEPEIEELLRAHGFASPRWHGVRRRWVASSYDPGT
ncbi:MAG TPA: class I SAM-dependent methyltransferase [Ramlibacter sp.]|jgi:SAM-dependent methyltransferase